MSRTDLDAGTLARMLRRKAGDGSVEWVYEPIQASVLLDIADMLDENAKLREYIERKKVLQDYARLFDDNAKLRKLVKRMHDHIKESCDICDEDYCSSWDEDNECCVFDTMLREVMVVRP